MVALARIAEVHPTPALRDALPVLREYLSRSRPKRWFTGPPDAALGRYETALEVIEAAVASLPPSEPTLNLPVPGGHPGPSAAGLPLPAYPDEGRDG